MNGTSEGQSLQAERTEGRREEHMGKEKRRGTKQAYMQIQQRNTSINIISGVRNIINIIPKLILLNYQPGNNHYIDHMKYQ